MPRRRATLPFGQIDPDGLDAEGGFASDLAHVDNDGGVPAALTTPHGMTTLDDRILVLDDGQDELWQLDPNVSNPNLRTLPSGLISPTGVTVLGTRLLVVDNAGDGLWEINADGADGQGTKLRDLPSNLSGPQGMAAYDGTRLLIADNAGDELWEIDPDGADTEGALLRLLPSDLISPLAMVDFPGLPPVFGDPGQASWIMDARDATGSEVEPAGGGADHAGWTADARGATGSIVPSVGEPDRAGWTGGVISVAGSVVPPVVGDAGLAGWATDARGVTGKHGPVYGSAGRAEWRAGARDATGAVVQPVTGSAGRASWRTRARRVSGSLGMVDPVNGSAGRTGWNARTRGPVGSVIPPVTGLAGRAGWRTRTRRITGSPGVNDPVGGYAGLKGWRIGVLNVSGSTGTVNPVNGSAGRAGWRSRTRRITGSEPSRNVALAILSLNVSGLTPAFASGTLAYTVDVPASAGNVMIMATAEDAGATVAFAPSSTVPLYPGANAATVTVTSAGGDTRTYSITITRARILIIHGAAATDSWRWEIDGISTPLSLDPYTVIDFDKMGMPDPQITRTALPFGGSRITHVRFGERNCSLTLRIRARSAIDAQAAAEGLMSRLFQQAPGLTVRQGELIRTRYDGTERRLRCVLKGGLMLERNSWRTPIRRMVQLMFEASHPWWYESQRSLVMASLSNDKDYPEFPLQFTGDGDGFSWGEIAGGNLIEINLTDSAITPSLSAMIEIAGPITNPFVKHIESGREIATTLDVPAGQVLTMRMGGDPAIADDRMEVTLEPSGADRFSTLNANFAKIILWPGENTIQFGHDGNDEGNQVCVSWRTEYGSG